MKRYGSMIVLAMLISMAACKRQTSSINAVLQDERQRGELMDSISNDQALMTEMMGHMMQSDRAVQLMGGNHGMMGKMMGNHQMMMAIMAKDTAMAGKMMEDMMAMMEKDSAICSMMGGRMMRNQHMMGMMHRMGQSGDPMGGTKMHQNRQGGMKNKSGFICPLHQTGNQ